MQFFIYCPEMSIKYILYRYTVHAYVGTYLLPRVEIGGIYDLLHKYYLYQSIRIQVPIAYLYF